MDSVDPSPDESGAGEGGVTFFLPESELHRAALLLPDAPYAPESEYGRRDCLAESERYRGKFEELFPRDCRPQTGGSGQSSGSRAFANGTSVTDDESASSDEDNQVAELDDNDVPGAPPPPPKNPEDADCSCSVPDFLTTTHFTVIGTSAGELLQGSAVDGGGGDDTLQAGDGADVLSGGDGRDRLEPGNGNDSVSGGSGDDTVNGGPGSDIVLGGLGDDIVNGGPGHDTVCGDAGSDTISGGDGHDCASGGDGDDTINGGAGDDTIHGDAGADFMVGGEGDDWIDGGAGHDFLRGDEGDDTLTGGDGQDIFYFGAITERDEVRDFTTGADKLDMRGMGLTSWALIENHAADTDAGMLLAFAGNSVLLRGVHTLAASDFWL